MLLVRHPIHHAERYLRADLLRCWIFTAEELLYELAEYLSRRHPDVYTVTRHPVSAREDENGWYGEGRIKTITIVPFQETHNLELEEPLKAARSL